MTPRIDDEVIESTAGEIAAELARRGIDPTRPVYVRLEPEDRLTRGRQEVRARVEAEGFSDDEIDQLIGEARREANETMREKPQP
jgi:hypothetical protein